MRFRCHHCEPHTPRGFEYEDHTGTGCCPRCGRPPGRGVYLLTDVHFIVASPTGAISPSRDANALRVEKMGLPAIEASYIACQRRRDALALHRWDDFHATDDPRSATCLSCRGTKEWQDAARAFKELERELAAILDAVKATVDLGAAGG